MKPAYSDNEDEFFCAECSKPIKVELNNIKVSGDTIKRQWDVSLHKCEDDDG